MNGVHEAPQDRGEKSHMSGPDCSIAQAGEQLIAHALSVSPVIEADAESAESGLNLTDRVVAAIRDAGLYRMLVPACLGGKEDVLERRCRCLHGR
jgi:hypothetical protein